MRAISRASTRSGLGVGAQGLGEAPDPGRVQLRGGDTGAVQRLLEGGVIGAGRLEGHAGDAGTDPANDLPVPLGVVADAAGIAARPAASVEMIFRDVDADRRLRHLFRCPMLVMRASRSAFRSGLGKDEERSYSQPARSGLQCCDPSPRRRRREATLRRHRHPEPGTPPKTDKQSFSGHSRKTSKKPCAHLRARSRCGRNCGPRPKAAPAAHGQRSVARWLATSPATSDPG